MELLPGEAGEGPDGLLRQRGAHVLQKGEQRALILRRERLAAEQRQSVDIVRREQLAFRFGGKGFAVAKVPGLGLKAVFAAVGAETKSVTRTPSPLAMSQFLISP